METLWQDVKHGVRTMAAARGVSFLALLTLALGIGANTAIFSVVSSVLLRPLPYPHSERIFAIWEKRLRENRLTNPVSPADFLDWRNENRSFETVAAQSSITVDLIGSGEPERIATGQVTWSFFEVLGVRPAEGRFFLPEEEEPGRDTVVVVSHALWKRRLGGDPSLVGKDVNLGGMPHRVIGILPPSFRFADREIELWIPLAFPPELRLARAAHYLNVLGRLKPGVTLDQAQSDMDAIARRLEAGYPENRGHLANVVPLKEQLVSETRPLLFVLSAAVGLVLLIACANVSNLVLARAASREREICLRSALGAGRLRLIRQLLTESVVLALLGGIAGVLFAGWGVEAFKAMLPSGISAFGLGDFTLDGRVLAFTAGLSLLTGILVGLVPALHASRSNLTDGLKEGRSLSAGRSRARLRGALVVLEVAISLVLLSGTGLMIRTLLRLQEVKPGFTAENVMTFRLALPRTRYPEPRRIAAFYDELLSNLEGLSGILTAGAISILPLSGQDSRTGIGIEGRPPTPDEPTRAHYRVVTPDYFETMRIPLLEGRSLGATDDAGAPPVLLVNQEAARRYWPEGSPVGRRLSLGGTNVWREIVGVVGDVKHWGLDLNVNPEMYLPLAQAPTPSMIVVVRGADDPEAMAGAFRAQVRALDPDEPVSAIESMEQVVARSISPRRFFMVLLFVFAAVALVLAGVGIAGVVSYVVAERTHEIGIRMALGAGARDVLLLVVGRGMSLVVVGLAAGAVGALALTRALRSMLFGVTPTDPETLVAVALVVAAVALLASYLPARRATRVDPIVSLRYE